MGEIAYVRIDKGQQKQHTERMEMVAFAIFVVMALAFLVVILRSTYSLLASTSFANWASPSPSPPPPGASWGARIAYLVQSFARVWANLFGNIASNVSLWSALKTYGPVAGFLLYLYIVLQYMYKDGNDFYKSRILYLTAFVVPFVLVLATQLMPWFRDGSSSSSSSSVGGPGVAAAAGVASGSLGPSGDTTKHYLGVASILFFALLINYLSNLPPDTTLFRAAGFSSYVLLFLILMFGLSLLYNMFLVRTFRMKSWPGFFVGVLFYLPCLVTDLVSFLTMQALGTPLSVYAIFVLELVFLLLYFYLPSWRNNSVRRLGVQVLVDPVEINQQRNISNYMDIFGEADKRYDEKINLPYARSQFSMSFWVYLHQPKFVTSKDSEVQIEILRFGNDVNPHPRFAYQVSKESQADGRFLMQWTNDPTKISTFSLPMQKWVHVFVNYGPSSYDVYVNGKMEVSMTRDSSSLVNPDLFQTTDPLSIGDDNHGMRGGIADMVFFPLALKHNEIEVLARSREEQPTTTNTDSV